MKDILKKIWNSWSLLIQQINKAIVYVLLSLLFFLLVTPQACFRRYFNKKTKKRGLLYREHKYTCDDLLKPW